MPGGIILTNSNQLLILKQISKILAASSSQKVVKMYNPNDLVSRYTILIK